jgi:hypothetical protein
MAWADAASLSPGARPGFRSARCLRKIDFIQKNQIDLGQKLLSLKSDGLFAVRRET